MMNREPFSYWQETAPHPTFSSILPSAADIVVVGGGLFGTSTCYWAARTGASVVLLERETFAAGATGRNAGFISVGPDEAYHHAILRLGKEVAQAILHRTLENRVLLRQVLEEEGIACDYREPGHLHLALNQEQLQDFTKSSISLQQDGVSAYSFDRLQTQEYIRTPLGPEILGGLFVPEMGLLHSVRFIQGLGIAAQRYGAHAVHATVQKVSPSQHKIRLQTTQGMIEAGSVIVATNAYLGDLFPFLAQIITPVRGQMLAYQPRISVFPTGVTVELAGSEEYWQQTPDGTILLGGCRTVAAGNDVGIRVNQPTAEIQDALERVFPQLFPQLPPLRVTQRWAGIMAFTPDFLPIVDRVPDLPNTWVVGGFCGHGMPFGLRFGQLLAESALKNSSPRELRPFHLDRSTLKPFHT